MCIARAVGRVPEEHAVLLAHEQRGAGSLRAALPSASPTCSRDVDAERMLLSAHCAAQVKTYPNHQRVYSEGEKGDEFFIIGTKLQREIAITFARGCSRRRSRCDGAGQ